MTSRPETATAARTPRTPWGGVPETPWHPIGFAAAYVLNTWVATSISPYAVVRSLLVAIFAALLVMLMGTIILRDARRGGLLASGVAALVIFGREVAVAVSNAIGLVSGWQIAILAGLFAGLAVAVVVLAWRSPPRPGGLAAWTRWLNWVAAILLLVIVGTGVAKGMVGQAIGDLHQGVPLAAAADQSTQQPAGPDIYVIMLDGYPRADVLAEQFGFDNAPFLDALEDHGFVVAPASHSNYMLTQLTLASLFYMDLLDDVPAFGPLLDRAIPQQPTGRKLLNSNPTIDLLRARGYAIAAVSASFEDVSLRKADVFIEGPELNDFERHLLGSTFVLDSIAWISPDFFPSQRRALIDGAFNHTAGVAADRRLGPRLLLAHVMAPHSPLVFGPNGEPLDVPVLRRTTDTAAASGLTQAELSERLVGQVQYVNGRTIEVLDAILAASPEPPVIILFSDHGPRTSAFDPGNPNSDGVREQFGTLFAAYTPGHEALYPPDITPAGVMGRLFEAYFGIPFREPGGGIFASDGSQAYRLSRIGDAPPLP